MPTPFLKDRYKTFFGEVAGLTTVDYYAFTEGGGIDELTGDVLDEGQAYAETPVSLSALIIHSPSQATREKVGLEIEFDALVRLSLQQLLEKSVTVRVGDAFILPGDLQPPTSIVDQTTYITARVHSILDDATDHTSRKVKITYKPTGLSEVCTVYRDSGQNKIDTTGLLGQEAVDTITANYMIRVYDKTQWHYAKKLVLGKQFEDEFLDLTVAVKRGTGRRG